MQIVIISTFTLLALLFCESSITASASLRERTTHWTRRARHYQSDRQKAEERRKLLDQASLDKQLIKQVIKGDVVRVGKLLRQGASANAQCAQDISALVYATFYEHAINQPWCRYYKHSLREDPEVVKLLMRYGAKCRLSRLKTGKKCDPCSLLTFIAQMSDFHWNEESLKTGRSTVAALCSNLYRDTGQEGEVDNLHTIFKILNERLQTSLRAKDNDDELIVWINAARAVFHAAINPYEYQFLKTPLTKGLQEEHLKTVKDALSDKEILPQELVELTCECLYPNPQPGILPSDLRAVLSTDFLTDRDVGRIKHYIASCGDVCARVNQGNTDTLCDLLDLVYKFDNVNLFKKIYRDRLSDNKNKIAFCERLLKACEKQPERITQCMRRHMQDTMCGNAECRDVEFLKQALEMGCDVNVKQYSKNSLSLVILKAQFNEQKAYTCMCLLLRKGIVIQEGNEDALLNAVVYHKCSARCIALLLYMGARYNGDDQNYRKVCEATGDEQIKKMLADPDHIERYVTPQQLEEFAAIKKEREESLQKMKEKKQKMKEKSACQTAAAPKA